jgi:hypothetical protein
MSEAPYSETPDIFRTMLPMSRTLNVPFLARLPTQKVPCTQDAILGKLYAPKDPCSQSLMVQKSHESGIMCLQSFIHTLFHAPTVPMYTPPLNSV